MGNGVIWLALTLYYLYNGRAEFAEHATNFLYGLILDIVTVATIKHIFKRPRPKRRGSSNPEEANSKEFDFGPDKYSFPSGHASRAVFIASFLTQEFKIRYILKYTWDYVISTVVEIRPMMMMVTNHSEFWSIVLLPLLLEIS